MDKADPGSGSQATDLDAGLALVHQLVTKREQLERELAVCEMELRAAWLAVPHMPVRSADELAALEYHGSYHDRKRYTMFRSLEEKVHEQRAKRMLRAARGHAGMAKVLEELLYGD